MPSPRLIYPLSGEGILMSMVATQISAANKEDITIFCVAFNEKKESIIEYNVCEGCLNEI